LLDSAGVLDSTFSWALVAAAASPSLSARPVLSPALSDLQAADAQQQAGAHGRDATGCRQASKQAVGSATASGQELQQHAIQQHAIQVITVIQVIQVLLVALAWLLFWFWLCPHLCRLVLPGFSDIVGLHASAGGKDPHAQSQSITSSSTSSRASLVRGAAYAAASAQAPAGAAVLVVVGGQGASS
jgi:hypothetical protein